MRSLVPAYTAPQVYMDYDGQDARKVTASKQIDDVITIDDSDDEVENNSANSGRQSPPMLKISDTFSLNPQKPPQVKNSGNSSGPVVMTLQQYMAATGVQKTLSSLDRIGVVRPPLQQQSPRKTVKSVPPCGLCGKKFDRFERYEAHMLSHQGIKANKCQLCERKYARRDALRNHVKQSHPDDFQRLYGPPTVSKVMDLTQDEDDDNS